MSDTQNTQPKNATHLSHAQLAAVVVAVRLHRAAHHPQEQGALVAVRPVPAEPADSTDPWVVAGRLRQNQSWHPHKRS